MNKNLTVLIALFCALPTLQATTIQVTLPGLQFSSANDGPFYLDFTLTGTAGNTVNISGANFGRGGSATGTSGTTSGGASGSLSSDILLVDGPSSFYNDFFQGFTPASIPTIGFTIDMTNIDSSTPDTLAISLLDSSTLPVPTLDPTGADTLLTITLGATPGYASYAVDDSQSTSDLIYPTVGAAVVTPVSGAPEPSTWMSAILGLGACLLIARRRAATALALVGSIAAIGSASAQTCNLFTAPAGSPIAVASGRAATGVAVGDFDGDGIPDMAAVTVTTTSSAVLAVYKGDGSGGFTPYGGSPFALSSTLMNGGNAVSLAAADFNHDGKLDLILTSDGGSVVLILGLGNGQFNIPTAATLTVTAITAIPQVQVADLNGDGYPDAIVNSNTSVVVILNTAGNLAVSQSVAGEQMGWFADVNNDGFPDLAAKSGKIYLNNTHGSFSTTAVTTLALPSTTTPSYIAAGDFTGDGKTDLLYVGITPNNQSFQYQEFTGDGAGNFTAGAVVQGNFTFTGAISVFNVVTGDFNGDGLLDFAFSQAGGGTNSLYVYEGSGQGAFALGTGTPFNVGIAGGEATAVATMDVNADGRPDLLVAGRDSSTNGEVSVFLTNAGSLNIGITTSANPAITGTSLTLTAIVGGYATACAAPTGHVRFAVDGGTGISVTLSGGKASTTLPSGLTAGVHTINASYAGDANFAHTQVNYVQVVGSSACSANLTGQVTLKPGGFVFDRVHQQFVQTVSITNNGQSALTGPVSLALDSLSTNASLVSPSGYTNCATPSSSPLADLGICPNTPLASGATASVILRFTDPSLTAISYTPRVLAGLSPR